MTSYINQTRVGDNTWAVNPGNFISFGTSGNQITIGASLGFVGTGGVTIATSGSVLSIASNRVLLATATAGTSASIEFTTSFDNTRYRNYLIRLTNIIPQTDDVSLVMDPSSNLGGTYWSGAGNLLSTQSYLYTAYSLSYATDSWYISPPINTGEIKAASPGYTGEIKLCAVLVNDGNTNNARPSFRADGGYWLSTTAPNVTSAVGFLGPRAEINAIKFRMTSGNIRSGIFEFYGEK